MQSLYSQLNQEKVILREHPVATAESKFSQIFLYAGCGTEEVSNNKKKEIEKNVDNRIISI